MERAHRVIRDPRLLGQIAQVDGTPARQPMVGRQDAVHRVGEQLHTVLKDYKRSPNANVRERHLWQVAAILHRSTANHRHHIVAEAERGWDTVTIVPSKTERPETHPLETAIGLAEPLASEYTRLLAPNDVSQIGRNMSSDVGFRLTEDVEGLSVLLIDDTWASGGHSQSAAEVLKSAGAGRAGLVVIGRHLQRSWEIVPGGPTSGAEWVWVTLHQTWPRSIPVCFFNRSANLS